MDRKIIIGLIILLCIVAVVVGIVETVNNKKDTKENLIGTVTDEELNNEKNVNDMSYDEIINQFNSIFDNTIDLQKINIVGLKKIDESKDSYVYSSTHYNGTVTNKYNIDARIPNININNDAIIDLNKKIDKFYSNRINTIIKNSNNYMNYKVVYKAYVNYDILSLIIKETLQTNDAAQQIAVKTYNYDIQNKCLVSLEDLIKKKDLNDKNINEKIKTTLEMGNTRADSNKQLGANVYYRDSTNDIYKIENTNNYFLGLNGKIYLVYTYNQKDVSDFDVVVIE